MAWYDEAVFYHIYPPFARGGSRVPGIPYFGKYIDIS